MARKRRYRKASIFSIATPESLYEALVKLAGEHQRDDDPLSVRVTLGVRVRETRPSAWCWFR